MTKGISNGVKQDALLRIVQTWKLHPKPEYRGFRCAHCQRSLHKAWHHRLAFGGYKIAVHLCQSCESLFKQDKLKVRGQRRLVFTSRFSTNFYLKIKSKLHNFLGRTLTRTVHKSFTCDKCRTRLKKAYHIWLFLGGSLHELHFCKRCGDQLFKK